MNKNLSILINVILVLIILFLLKECSDTKTISNQNEENLTLQNHTFKVISDKKDQKIAQQEQEIVSKQSTINKLVDKVEGLTKINTQVKIVTETKIDSIIVPIDRPVYVKTSNGDCLMLPANFRKLDNPWYGFVGTITERGYEEIDSLWIINKPEITFGLTSFNVKEFLKHPLTKRVPEVSFEDKNPYSSTKKLSSVKLDKPLPKFSIGIQGGYGMTSKGLGGYIGIGLNYNLITF